MSHQRLRSARILKLTQCKGLRSTSGHQPVKENNNDKETERKQRSYMRPRRKSVQYYRHEDQNESSYLDITDPTDKTYMPSSDQSENDTSQSFMLSNSEVKDSSLSLHKNSVNRNSTSTCTNTCNEINKNNPASDTEDSLVHCIPTPAINHTNLFLSDPGDSVVQFAPVAANNLTYLSATYPCHSVGQTAPTPATTYSGDSVVQSTPTPAINHTDISSSHPGDNVVQTPLTSATTIYNGDSMVQTTPTPAINHTDVSSSNPSDNVVQTAPTSATTNDTGDNMVQATPRPAINHTGVSSRLPADNVVQTPLKSATTIYSGDSMVQTTPTPAINHTDVSSSNPGDNVVQTAPTSATTNDAGDNMVQATPRPAINHTDVSSSHPGNNIVETAPISATTNDTGDNMVQATPTPAINHTDVTSRLPGHNAVQTAPTPASTTYAGDIVVITPAINNASCLSLDLGDSALDHTYIPPRDSGNGFDFIQPYHLNVNSIQSSELNGSYDKLNNIDDEFWLEGNFSESAKEDNILRASTPIKNQLQPQLEQAMSGIEEFVNDNNPGDRNDNASNESTVFEDSDEDRQKYNLANTKKTHFTKKMRNNKKYCNKNYLEYNFCDTPKDFVLPSKVTENHSSLLEQAMSDIEEPDDDKDECYHPSSENCSSTSDDIDDDELMRDCSLSDITQPYSEQKVTSYETSKEQFDEKLKKNIQSTTQYQQDDAEEEEMKEVHSKAEQGLSQDNATLSEEGLMKGKRVRQRDFCFYCETYILNFARHMVRNHPAEPEVQKALAAPKKSANRKKIFRDLQKKGNYISNLQSSFKPMKKSSFSDKTDYLPCSKCLGFYSKKLLWKHLKKCDHNLTTNNAQVHAQNFLLRNVKVDKNLMSEVFPRMKPDKISLIAKKDSLICMFGAQYLRSHREKHFATVVSRKMRELAKLFVEVSNLKPHIVSLEQALRPQYYDTLVQATKIVARYDETKSQFDAPTYAMNIATSIKQCCSIALLDSCKTEATVDTARVQADLKTLSSIIGDNWKFDISSQAADDLNVKKWNKTTIVPLASDLKLFKDYLCKVAKQAADSMAQSKENVNLEAFNNLMESTYCRVILLNRRRPGELQRLKLSDYMKHGNESNKYEEFEKVLSPTERILVDQLKRIVIRGKRGRGVPVLFSAEIQMDIKRILDVRHLYVENDNNMLFVKAGGTTICGYKTLEKHAKASGVQNYRALTSTRLRKHLATMTQLFTMNESEMEQLATFMGHTLSVHKDNYRLPNDVYQTAKISKLLLLMEDGQADKYQGKTLDQINLNMNEEIIGEEIENEEVVDFEMTDEDPISKPKGHISNNPVHHSSIAEEVPLKDTSNKNPAKKKRTLIPWTTEQKNVVTKYFKDHIKNKRPPKRAECDALKDKYSKLLQNKDWLKIKVYVQNSYTKK